MEYGTEKSKTNEQISLLLRQSSSLSVNYPANLKGLENLTGSRNLDVRESE